MIESKQRQVILASRPELTSPGKISSVFEFHLVISWKKDERNDQINPKTLGPPPYLLELDINELLAWEISDASISHDLTEVMLKAD